MTEQPVKKRGWVKNAAIVFLAVLLLLTFFSNTIMNISLPEVSTAVVQGGSITESISGSGTITANSVFEVKVDQTRTVESLMVRVGDTVEEGSVLFTLKGETPDLDAAVAELARAKDSYQQVLIGSTSKADQLELTRLQETINDLKKERDLAIQKGNITGVTMDKAAAELALADATRAETTAQGNFDTANAAMIRDYPNTSTGLATSFGPPVTEPTGNESTLRAAVDSAERAYDNARDALDDAEDALSDAEDAAGQAWDDDQALPTPTLTMSRKQYITQQTKAQQTAVDTADRALDSAGYTLESAEDALSNYLNSVSDYDRLMRPYLSRVEDLNRLKQILDDATAAKKKAADALSSITGQGGTSAIDEQIKTAEKNLLDKQLQIEKSNQNLNLSASTAKRAVDDAQAKLDKLKAEGSGAEITAPVAGIVKTLNVTPGQEISPTAAIPATIEMPENGYYLKFAVTNAQAENLRPGIEATEVNNWWGVQLRYTLANISNDPDNSQSKKMLLFTVTGEDVSGETGRSHTLEIGAPAGNYDRIVPTTALHTDSQGDFVLLLQQKSTPLGTRFLAVRIDVTILAQDNTNAAISGGLSSWDYVITVSSAPVEAGQYVRLAE